MRSGTVGKNLRSRYYTGHWRKARTSVRVVWKGGRFLRKENVLNQDINGNLVYSNNNGRGLLVVSSNIHSHLSLNCWTSVSFQSSHALNQIKDYVFHFYFETRLIKVICFRQWNISTKCCVTLWDFEKVSLKRGSLLFFSPSTILLLEAQRAQWASYTLRIRKILRMMEQRAQSRLAIAECNASRIKPFS